MTSHLQSANRTNVEDPRFKIRTSVRVRPSRRAVWQFLPFDLPNPNCVIAPSAIPPFIDPLMDSSLLGIAKWNGFNAVSPPSLPAAIEGRIPRESVPTAVSPSLVKTTLDRLRNFSRRAASNTKLRGTVAPPHRDIFHPHPSLPPARRSFVAEQSKEVWS